MAHTHTPNRRRFLSLSAKLAAIGLGGAVARPASVFSAEVADTTTLTDYKALVCIYLFGGNDGNNMIVPVDTTRYTTYQGLRSGIALSPGSLLPAIADPGDPSKPYALHYGLPEVNALYGAGNVAFVLNMGQLDQPLTRTEYLAGQKTPTNLFSHSDQTVQAQSGVTQASGTGWGGRLLDCCGVTDNLAAISVSSPALFLQGTNVAGNSIQPGQGLSLDGMNLWPQSQGQSRRAAVNALLGIDGGNLIRKAANKALFDGLQLADTLAGAAGGGDGLVFPGTPIGNQLREVARLIRVRAALGPGRQVFFCSMGGFDLHSGQDWTHWNLLSQLSAGLDRFHKTMEDALLAPNVTAFTQTEFGRTMQSTGTGSDHAWGNHQMVVGGAVKGGIYGAMPTLALGGPDDATNRGVWIPKISTAQFGATLGKWFGASGDDLAWAFPSLEKFDTSDIGFMKP